MRTNGPTTCMENSGETPLPSPWFRGKRGECTLQNRREESRTARVDSVRRPALVDSAYRTRISGFAACRNDDWSDAMPSKIEDYAMLGDCETSALVARNGSVDWLCWPRFDSNACFAALLGTRDHGRWLIATQEQARVTRRYRPNTLILETHFETADGAATLVDFMPFRAEHSEIVRLVVGTRGKLKMHTELVLRFGYGAVVPWVTRLENGALRAIAGPDMVVLRTSVRVSGKDMTTIGEFTISRGEPIPLVLTYSRSHKTLP